MEREQAERTQAAVGAYLRDGIDSVWIGRVMYVSNCGELADQHGRGGENRHRARRGAADQCDFLPPLHQG